MDLTIEGMTCGHCVAAVERALRAVEGVSDVSVDLEAGTATVAATGSVDRARLAEAVRAEGYDVPA